MTRKGTRVLIPPTASRELAPSPLAGRAGVGFTPRQAIETLQPRDWVYAHDGQSHPIVLVAMRRYVGKMVRLSHKLSSEPLWLTADHLVLTARRVHQLARNGEWSGIPSTHVDFARTMRHQATPPEAHLWKRLRGNALGVTFRRQHQIGPYIADFYCRQASLLVEVDGVGTHSSEEARDYDRQRDAYLAALGLRVIRFTASDVIYQTNAVIEAILHAVRETVLTDDPEKQWRYASTLIMGDYAYFGVNQQLEAITDITVEETVEEVYNLEVLGAPSFLTEVCAVHAAGSFLG